MIGILFYLNIKSYEYYRTGINGSLLLYIKILLNTVGIITFELLVMCWMLLRINIYSYIDIGMFFFVNGFNAFFILLNKNINAFLGLSFEDQVKTYKWSKVR